MANKRNNKFKFTDLSIKSLTTTKPQEDFYDSHFSEGCLGIRVSKSGRKAFFTRNYVNGKQKRLMLGIYNPTTASDGEGRFGVAEARSKARRVVSAIEDGNDPQVEKQARRIASTFGDLVDVYFSRHGKNLAVTTQRNWKAMLKKDVLPVWRDRKASDITRRDVLDVLNRIAFEREKPIQANRTRESINAVFNFAISQDLIESNPCAFVKKPAKENVGERYLTELELKLLWEETEGEQFDVSLRVWYRLQILLGLRPGEPLKIAWDNIDGRTLHLPGSKLKNNQTHELYLSDLVFTELSLLQRGEKYLFPGLRKDSHRKGYEAACRNFRSTFSVKDWTARDIRRSVETHMRRIKGIDGEIVSRILNHDVSTIRKHYDKNTYWPEKKQALSRWSEWVGALVNDEHTKKVVNFPGGR